MDNKLENISEQWNSIAKVRFDTLKNKADKTYEEILVPLFVSYAREFKNLKFLDVGCGLGFLTKELSKLADKITAIDISEKSLALASEFNSANNLKYINISIEDYRQDSSFDLVVANMVLMDMPSIELALKSIHNLLKNNGRFFFTITHPVFWPIYWHYENKESFNYNQELELTEDFKIGSTTYKDYKTSHFHRPLSYYLNTLLQCGYKIERITELSDTDNAHWYPRFLAMELSKDTHNQC